MEDPSPLTRWIRITKQNNNNPTESTVNYNMVTYNTNQNNNNNFNKPSKNIHNQNIRENSKKKDWSSIVTFGNSMVQLQNKQYWVIPHFITG